MIFPFLADPPFGFAHRGGDAGEENTLAAFEHALARGLKIETDVQATSDGVAVFFHDPSLVRMTKGTDRRRISEITFAELSHVTLVGGAVIPRVDELVDAFPDAEWNIDIKRDNAVDPVIEVVRRTGAIRRVLIGSFSDTRIALARQALGPDLATSMGTRAALRFRLAARLPGYRPTAPAAQLPYTLPPRLARHAPAGLRRRPLINQRMIDFADRVGVQIHAWTVNDRAAMIALLQAGVHGIVTDEVDTLADLLVRPELWRVEREARRVPKS